MPLKQVILARQDLKLPKGKLAVQCAHASVQAALDSDRRMIEEWLAEGGKKVVLKVKDKEEMVKLKKEAEKQRLVTALIIDSGKTVVKPGTMTCLGIGPDEEKKIDRVTGELKIV